MFSEFLLVSFFHTSADRPVTLLHSPSCLQLYNGLPILLVGVFDQDVSAREALDYPFLYNDGLIGAALNKSVFWGWILSAFVDSFACFFFPYTAFTFGEPDGASR